MDLSNLNNIVYLDNAATTPCDMRVIESMNMYMNSNFANPSSPHILGKLARQVVEDCRCTVGDRLKGSGSVLFTSGSTESNNLAINSAFRHSISQPNRKRVLCLSTEHKSVINAVTYFADLLGLYVEWIPVDVNGVIDMNWFFEELREDVAVVVVQLANSETGTIQPVSTIAHLCHEYGVVCCSDLTQGIGKIDVSLDQLDVDYATFTAHKFYGPKGVGALYASPSIKVAPLTFGGGQERGVRPGTENVPGVVGMCQALKLSLDELERDAVRIRVLRQRLWTGLEVIQGIRWNGKDTELLPSHLNVTIRGVNAQDLLLRVRDVAFSAGSACNTSSNLPSPVLLAMGLSAQEAEETIRLSLGRHTTQRDIDLAISSLLRGISDIRH